MKKNLLLVALPILVLASCGESSGGGGSGGGGGGGGGGSCSTPISVEAAKEIASQINAYLTANPIKKVDIRVKTDAETLAVYQFNEATMYSYQWSNDSYGDGDYTFTTGKTGYYYFERGYGQVDPESPEITKWYEVFYNLQDDDFNPSGFTSFSSAYNQNTISARSHASVSIEASEIEENQYTTFYSCGAGSLVIDVNYAGYYQLYTEYRDYKPYKMTNMTGEGMVYYSYDFTEEKPADMGSYTKYGEFGNAS